MRPGRPVDHLIRAVNFLTLQVDTDEQDLRPSIPWMSLKVISAGSRARSTSPEAKARDDSARSGSNRAGRLCISCRRDHQQYGYQRGLEREATGAADPAAPIHRTYGTASMITQKLLGACLALLDEC